MDKIANTLTIDIYAEASCPNAEYNVGIDDVGQITITPIDASCNFTFVSREPAEDKISIHLTANMTSTDDNFEYFLDIDEIGQIIITPDSENSNFESVAEGADLNLVTECGHFKVSTEGEELDEDVESDGEPYTYEQVETDLRSLTMNWTKEDTLKTTFEVEHQYAMDILSKHYETVYDEGRKGSWYYIRFVGPMTKECLTEGTSDYYTRSDVEAVREKFKKWAFKIDSQHPGFDRYTCKVDDYLLECVFDHKFGSPAEKCFTARVLLNRKTMDYFFTAEDALDFMLANAENKVLDEELDDKLSPSSSDMNELANIARAHNVTILSSMKDGELRFAGTLKDLKAFYSKLNDDGEVAESKQGECEKCGHVLTDGGQCPVCDLGDEEERTSHTLYEGLSFQEGDVLEYSGLFGGSYTSRVTKIQGSKMWVDTSWTAEESGEEIHDEDTFFIVKDDEGNDCIEVYHYQGEVGRVYPPATKVNESYWINNKEIMSEVSNLGKQLEADGYKYYGDRDAGGTYFDFYTKPGNNGADCKAVRYNYQGAAIVDITIDQLTGKEPLTQFDGLRRKLGKILLPESMSSSDAIEMIKIAKEIGIHSGEDLIRFYKDHPACDEHKLEVIKDYRKELGPDFKLEEGTRVSFDLDGKKYRGTYRGQSTTNPDMADVEMDDDCYENPDPYGRHINRRPIYNRHEDRYIKDGKFFIPTKELRFEED